MSTAMVSVMLLRHPPHGRFIAMRSYARRSRLRHMPITSRKWTVPATAIPVSAGPHESLQIHFPASHTMR